MDEAARQLVEDIHATAPRGVFAITGGGGSTLASLLVVPGASRTVLEAVIPYHFQSLTEYLGQAPEQACSPEVAIGLAERSFVRARRLAPTEPVFGIGGTAALATDRIRRGDDRFHLAVVTASGRDLESLHFPKGRYTRSEQDHLLTTMFLNTVARTCGTYRRMSLPDDCQLTHDSFPPLDGPLAAFFRGELSTVCQEPDGRFRTGEPYPAAVMPGSFNPLHVGHRRMIEVAGRRLGCPVAYELSVVNADKPELALGTVRSRLAQFLGRSPIWLTRCPTFVEKAEQLPGTVFVVGADTADRIVQPRYYGNEPAAMARALERIRERGCQFLVAGRVDAQGRFVGLEQVCIPTEFADLFIGLSEAEFRIDISSTQLRCGVAPLVSG